MTALRRLFVFIVCLLATTPAISASPPASECEGVSAVSDYYEDAKYALYGFRGEEAVAIAESIAVFAGHLLKPIKTVYVGLNLQNFLADMFLFDEAGCFIASIGPADEMFARVVLERAGVTVPFGEGFYQIPDLSL